jgi:hypothetical protein
VRSLRGAESPTNDTAVQTAVRATSLCANINAFGSADRVPHRSAVVDSELSTFGQTYDATNMHTFRPAESSTICSAHWAAIGSACVRADCAADFVEAELSTVLPALRAAVLYSLCDAKSPTLE